MGGWQLSHGGGQAQTEARMQAVPRMSAVGRRVSWPVSSPACRARQQCLLTAWGGGGRVRGAPGGPKSWQARPFSTCGPRADDTRETAPSGSLSPPPWGGFWQGSVRGPHCPACPPPPVGVTLSPAPAASVWGCVVRQGKHHGPLGPGEPTRGPAGQQEASGPEGRVQVTRLQTQQGVRGPRARRGSLLPPCRQWRED